MVENVAKGGTNPYRPDIPKIAEDEEIDVDILELMQMCWDEDSDHRPDFNKIKNKMKAINKGKWVLCEHLTMYCTGDWC